MKIELMNDSHLEKILKIDQDAFERDEPRTVSNLKGLREGDPEGCFVLMDGNDLVGYSFNKTWEKKVTWDQWVFNHHFMGGVGVRN